jgi:hypothetical protein
VKRGLATVAGAGATVRRLAVLAAAALCFVAPLPAAAADLLTGVEVTTSDAGLVITVQFSTPRRVVTHVPERRGDLLEIRLAPIVPMAGAGEFREVAPYRSDNEIPLAEVVYEPRTEGGGSLLLRFVRTTEFTVAAAADLRSVTITLLGEVLPGAAGDPEETLGRAKKAIVAGDYASAIELCSRLLAAPPGDYTPVAIELLGLARERSGDFAAARTEYEAYLDRYPDAAGATRVRQRLQGLATRTGPPPAKLRDPQSDGEGVEWAFHGNASQFYRYDGTVSDEDDALLSESALFSDVSLRASRRTSLTEVRARIEGGYVQDFRHGSESELDVDEAYVEMGDRGKRIEGAVGRQVRSTGGVLGRMDGGLLGFRATPWLRVNAVGGLASPYTTDDDVDTSRPLYGLELEIGPWFGALSASIYGIEQRIDGLVDRRAVGGEIHYLDRNVSGFGLLDYDIYFDRLNIGLALVTYNFANSASVTGTYDHRLTPVLTMSNALQGQIDDDMDELRDTYSTGEIEDLARARTGTSDSAAVSGAYPLTENLQLAGDLTWFKLSGLDAAGGVEATPGTKDEFFSTVQLIANDWLARRDITTAALRYADTHAWNSVGVSLLSRVPFGDRWRIHPRFLLDYRMLDAAGGDQVVIRPSSRLEWSWRKGLDLELELGGQWVSNDTDSTVDAPFGYFVSAGYRWDF